MKLSADDNKRAESNEEFYWNSKADNIKGDIRDYHLLKDAMRGVDYVFHHAAESRIQPAILNPIEAVSKNCRCHCPSRCQRSRSQKSNLLFHFIGYGFQ